MKYFSIDLETTGVNSDRHQIIEFAAIFEDTKKQLPFDRIPKFHCFIEHDEIIGSPFALNMNARVFKLLVEKDTQKYLYLNEAQLVEEFAKFVKKQIGKHKIQKIVCAGKNFGTFDKPFLEKLPNWNNKIKINQRILDPANMYIDFKNDEVLPNTTQCMRRANLELKNLHFATYDAWNIIQLLRKIY